MARNTSSLRSPIDILTNTSLGAFRFWHSAVSSAKLTRFRSARHRLHGGLDVNLTSLSHPHYADTRIAHPPQPQQGNQPRGRAHPSHTSAAGSRPIRPAISDAKSARYSVVICWFAGFQPGRGQFSRRLTVREDQRVCGAPPQRLRSDRCGPLYLDGCTVRRFEMHLTQALACSRFDPARQKPRSRRRSRRVSIHGPTEAPTSEPTAKQGAYRTLSVEHFRIRNEEVTRRIVLTEPGVLHVPLEA